MGMLEHEFNKCTPRYFRARLDGMRTAQQQDFRNQWELTRWMAATMISPHLKRPISPQKLMRFPWEVSDHDDIVAKITRYADIFAKLTPPAEA
jgi:hypothetical protein